MSISSGGWVVLGLLPNFALGYGDNKKQRAVPRGVQPNLDRRDARRRARSGSRVPPKSRHGAHRAAARHPG